MSIRTFALTKRYRAVTALESCDLDVHAGEVFGLLGPNGAGKTTLLRLLLGFLRPTSGLAVIDGLDCGRQSLAVRRRVSYLPGEARLFRPMRASDVLRLFARIRPETDLSRARAVADRLQLDLSRRVAVMSTGMRQKLALAIVLAADVPILILDEPTANLDPTVRQDVLHLVREARQSGRTVLISSHVFSEAEEVCDRVAILRRGRVVHLQDIAMLRKQHRIAARLTGPLPEIPEALRSQLEIHPNSNGRVLIEASGELPPLLGWLAALPIAEARIEPIGLKAVYERMQGDG